MVFLSPNILLEKEQSQITFVISQNLAEARELDEKCCNLEMVSWKTGMVV